jgi:hypothetical protein
MVSFNARLSFSTTSLAGPGWDGFTPQLSPFVGMPAPAMNPALLAWSGVDQLAGPASMSGWQAGPAFGGGSLGGWPASLSPALSPYAANLGVGGPFGFGNLDLGPAMMQSLLARQAMGMGAPYAGGAFGQGPGQQLDPQALLPILAFLLAELIGRLGCGCQQAGALPSTGYGSTRPLPGGWGGGAPATGGGGGAGGAGGAGGGGVGQIPPGQTQVPGGAPTGQGSSGRFLAAALAQQGDTYRFGAETRLDDANPNTFDCSELVQWAAAQAGVQIPDGSKWQRQHCRPISVQEALRIPGALLFKDGHVAISVGDGKNVMEARGTRDGVGVWPAGTRFTSGGLIPGMDYGSGPVA